MASKTSNVKIGVCRVYYGGVDLGYTQGGVEVSVSSTTHKVEIDQFGKTPIAESIMGREVKCKVPMAETTIENMAIVFPGATIVATGGTKATGTILLGTNPTNGQTLIVNGATITFKTSATLASEVTIGASAAATATALNTVLNASTDPRIAGATYTVATATVTATYDVAGTEGNSFTLAAGTSGATVSGAVLTGGAEPTTKRVDVTDGVAEGSNLLNLAKELRLHPMAKGDYSTSNYDASEDFVIPLAGVAGALNFAYKVENERVFNVEFTGYPDPTTRKLFYVGA